MEEQKRENKEELQQETAEEKNSGQGNSSTRSSLFPFIYPLCPSYTGRTKDTFVPSPCLLSIQIFPWWDSTTLLLKNSPNPVPPSETPRSNTWGISGSGRYFCCDRGSASDHGDP